MSMIASCWRQVGVEGDRSCPELAQHVHCRNCPTFSAAAQQILDQRASTSAVVHTPEAAPEQPGAALLVFRLGPEWFALPMTSLDEVVECRRIVPLPHKRGGALLGLANLRGALVMCISLQRVLGVEESDSARQPEARMIVTSDCGHRIAAPVDEVGGICRPAAQEMRAIFATIAKTASPFASALFTWRERTVGLLDEQRLVPAMNRCVA